jgi:NAD(P)-dependent dehydrogenase (short-subunit alcohol dehydrogenase family)
MSKKDSRKSIFITGAASGIGRAVAEHFASRGWFCGLFDIDAVGLQETLAKIGTNNGMSGLLDVRARDQWAEAVASFGSATGGTCDLLFNNAGIARHGWFEDIQPEEADLVIDVNLKGVINGVYAVFPLLKATQGARIINVASAAGIYGSPRLAVYSATKFAVRGLTEALDIEFAGHGIRVVSLMPFFVDTPILDAGSGDGSTHKMSDELKAAKMDVYPVSMAAEKTWEAAHGKALHVTVGKAADDLKFAARFFPNGLRKRLKSQMPPHRS